MTYKEAQEKSTGYFILEFKQPVIKKYHYRLRYGYEELFPSLPLSLRVLAEDFNQADTNVVIGYGYKVLEKYQIFTITKL